jgi:hypothetical protein
MKQRRGDCEAAAWWCDTKKYGILTRIIRAFERHVLVSKEQNNEEATAMVKKFRR